MEDYQDDSIETSLLTGFIDELEEISLQRVVQSKGIFSILADNKEVLLQRLDIVPKLQDLVFQTPEKKIFLKRLIPAFQQTIYVEIDAGAPSFLMELVELAKIEKIFLNFNNYFFFLFFELTEHFEKTIMELSQIWDLPLEEIQKNKIERLGQTSAIILRKEWKDKVEFETLIENLRAWNITLNDINERSNNIFSLFQNQNETELLTKIIKRTKNVGSFFFIEKKYCKNWDLIWEFICKEWMNHSFLIVSEESLDFKKELEEDFKKLQFENENFYYNYETLEEKLLEKDENK